MLIIIRTMIGYLKPYKLLTWMFLLFIGLDLIFISIAPLSFTYLIDYAVEPRSMGMFVNIITILAIAGILCTIAGIVGDYFLSKLNALVESDLRNQLFSKLQQLHINYYYTRRSGDTISLFSNDLPTISSALTSLLTTGIQSIVVVTISMGVLIYLQWSMAIIIVLGASLIFVGPLLLSKRAEQRYAQYKEQISKLNSEVQENVKAQKLIKSFNLQQYMYTRFSKRVKQLFVSSYNMNVMNAQLGRVPMISLVLVNFLIMAFGSYLALTEQITIGALVAFYTMYVSMGNSVYSLTFIIPILTDTKVSLERINEVLHNEKLEVNHKNDYKVPEQQLELMIENVSFGYTEQMHVLHNISLNIEAGSSIALVGSSGSGKSSLVQLLLGLYEPQQGQVKANGMPLSHIDLGYYRNQLAIVLQDNFLFQGTLVENISMSNADASFEDVVTAAKQAEIHEYIMSLPLGYETEVLDEGSNFSGGQRQRLAIARALVRNPQILILDEATSALDPATESSINATFKRLAKDRTIITVTHRLATIIEADKICVFEQGNLVEQGNHQQLLTLEGTYKYLWDKQSGLSLSEEGDEANIDIERLARLLFFRNINIDVLHSIANLFNTEKFDEGTTIIHEGDRGEKFYIIIRGRVEVLKKMQSNNGENVRVAVLEDGDHFGEIALLESVPRTASIKALTSCVVITLQRKVLHHVLKQHPEINEYVRKGIQQRMN